MVSPFETTINKMAELGMFKFLFPFMLTAAVFYGLLRKSQIFGDPDRNVAVNGIVALIAGFMVWAYPIISGVDITLQLSNFFMQGLILTVTVMFGLMIAGMFLPPNLSEVLDKHFKGGAWAAVIGVTILVAVIIVFTSGLFNTFFPQAIFGPGAMDQDTLMLIGTIVALIIGMIAIVGGGRAAGGGGEEKKTERKREE